jgi:hypothetical protein
MKNGFVYLLANFFMKMDKMICYRNKVRSLSKLIYKFLHVIIEEVHIWKNVEELMLGPI